MKRKRKPEKGIRDPERRLTRREPAWGQNLMINWRKIISLNHCHLKSWIRAVILFCEERGLVHEAIDSKGNSRSKVGKKRRAGSGSIKR